MIDRLRLYDVEEILTLQYEKYLLSWKIRNCDDEISRLNAICGRYEANQPGSNFEGKKELINDGIKLQVHSLIGVVIKRVSFRQGVG